MHRRKNTSITLRVFGPAAAGWLLFVVVTAYLIGCGSQPNESGPSDKPPTCFEGMQEKLAEMQEERQKLGGILAEKNLYSLTAEEVIIRDFFQDRRGGFFVDVGCAWPIKASNTYYLEKHLGWTGLGIDAVDDYAAAWKEKRPKSKFFNFLVSDRSGGSGTFFKSQRTGLSSTDRTRARGKIFGVTEEPEKVEVPIITLTDLLDREGIKKIDLLSLDIEGHELEALGGFDIERFAPELVVVEGGKELEEYFNQHGYELIARYAPLDLINVYYRRKPAAAPAAKPSP